MSQCRPMIEALEPIWLFDVEPIDPGFGNQGRLLADFGNTGTNVISRMIIQPDGKILSAGGGSGVQPAQSPVMRFNSDGSPDLSFGDAGQAKPFAAGTLPVDSVNDMVLDPQGRIIVTGIVHDGAIFRDGYAVERFLPDGSPDVSFGNQGAVFFPIPLSSGQINYSDISESVAIDSQGRILVGGNGDGDWTIVRFLADGTPDPAFGAGNGVEKLTDVPGDIRTLLPLPTGDFYAVGSQHSPTGYDHMLAVRFLSGGTPDPAFGAGGLALRGSDQLLGVASTAVLRPDGNLLVGGGEISQAAGAEAVVVYSILPDGSPDPAFGVGGRAVMSLGAGGSAFSSDATDMILRADGTLVVVGDVGSSFSPAMEAFNPDGTPLASFGTNGRIAVSGFAAVGTITQDAGGRIIIGGNQTEPPPQGSSNSTDTDQDENLTNDTDADDAQTAPPTPVKISFEMARYIPFPIVEISAVPPVMPLQSGLASATDYGSFLLGRTGDLSRSATLRVMLSGTGSDGKPQGTYITRIVVPATMSTAMIPVATYGPMVLSGGGTVQLSVIDSGTLSLLGSSAATVAFTSTTAGGAITGTVFNDVNGNGIFDAGDSPIAGRVVSVYKIRKGKRGARQGKVRADAEGNYRFTGLTAGTYQIILKVMPGFRGTTPANAMDVTVAANSIGGGFVSGQTTNALIEGRLFNSAAGRSPRIAQASPLAGWTVFIDANNDGVLDNSELYVTSAIDGAWSFDLPAGKYRIGVVKPAGWSNAPRENRPTIVRAGQSKTGVLLGVKQTAFHNFDGPPK